MLYSQAGQCSAIDKERIQMMTRMMVAIVSMVMAGPVVTIGSARGQGAGLGPSLGLEPSAVSYPPQEYYVALEIYRTGELDRAIDAFEFAINRTRRDINGHWIDAIPCYAMMAECQYYRGDLEAAMQSLDQVMTIAIRHRGWLRRPVWTEVLQTRAQLSPRQYLWNEANGVNRLATARRVKFYSGEQLTEERLALGGRIEELNIKNIDLLEVMRGLAIASYRRRIILGPLAEGDALATQVLDATKYPAEIKLPIARNLIGAMRAAERFGSREDKRALSDASQNATFSGGVHALPPIASLCAASAMAESDKPTAAVPICLNVANQAASLEHFEWIGEALQLAAGCATDKEAPLVQQAGKVAAASLLRQSRLASLHCLLAAADAAITGGDVASADALLSEAMALAGRRDVLQPRLDAYGAYVASRLAAVQSASDRSASVAPWDGALAQVLGFITSTRNRNRNLISMPRLFQLQRVRMALGRTIEGLSADELLAFYSGDPGIEEWRRDPVNAISGLIADRDALRVARLRTAASRESGNDVLLRIEDVQAGRVRQQFPLGGRVLDVKSLSRLDDQLLTKNAIEFRNAAAKPIRDLRAAAKAAIDAAAGDGASLLTGQAAERWNRMEADAWSIALGRYAVPTTVPRPLNQKMPAEELPDETALLCFFEDGNVIHAALCTKQKSTYWAIKGGNRLGTEIGKLLRNVGATPNRGGRLPEDDSWREDAVKLRDRLILPGTGPLLEGRLAGIKRLIVVPDGLLWYLPFEILPTQDAASVMLGDSVEVSYAATPALAMYPTAHSASKSQVAFAASRFFAPREMERNESIVQSIVDAAAAGGDPMVRLSPQNPIPTSHTGAIAGHLVLGQVVTPNPASILETTLTDYDKSPASGVLRSWNRYPPAVPASVFLAGFRSNLDNSQNVSGHELLHTIAALQYSGVRDVVISRWAVGGESTAVLLREYVQEVPFMGPSAAFQRAVSVLRRSELSPAREPTLSGSDMDRETLTGDQPLFWSTYLRASPL